MYELKGNGKVFTSKSVWTGPSSYEKKNLPVRGLTKVEKHWSETHPTRRVPQDVTICRFLFLFAGLYQIVVRKVAWTDSCSSVSFHQCPLLIFIYTDGRSLGTKAALDRCRVLFKE